MTPPYSEVALNGDLLSVRRRWVSLAALVFFLYVYLVNLLTIL